MRPLTEPELKVLIEKLATYCGGSIKDLIAGSTNGSDRFVFRIQKDRIYYVRVRSGMVPQTVV